MDFFFLQYMRQGDLNYKVRIIGTNFISVELYAHVGIIKDIYCHVLNENFVFLKKKKKWKICETLQNTDLLVIQSLNT